MASSVTRRQLVACFAVELGTPILRLHRFEPKLKVGSDLFNKTAETNLTL